MKNKKNKLFAALALGILIISGFANALPLNDNSLLNTQSSGVFKEIRENPLSFIKSEKVFLPNNFDYIDQMNNEFVGGSDLSGEETSYQIGDSLKALKEKDSQDS